MVNSDFFFSALVHLKFVFQTSSHDLFNNKQKTWNNENNFYVRLQLLSITSQNPVNLELIKHEIPTPIKVRSRSVTNQLKDKNSIVSFVSFWSSRMFQGGLVSVGVGTITVMLVSCWYFSEIVGHLSLKSLLDTAQCGSCQVDPGWAPSCWMKSQVSGCEGGPSAGSGSSACSTSWFTKGGKLNNSTYHADRGLRKQQHEELLLGRFHQGSTCRGSSSHPHLHQNQEQNFGPEPTWILLHLWVAALMKHLHVKPDHHWQSNLHSVFEVNVQINSDLLNGFFS